MPADATATLLRLMWLASPALPVGGFSYSDGLESAVDAGWVVDEASAGDWLAQQLQLQFARADGPLLVQALHGWRDFAQRGVAPLVALNDWQRATRECAEARAQTEQMGRSMAQWLANGEQADDPRVAALAALPGAPTWPLAFALGAAQAGADDGDALAAAAFSWAENAVQAAMKAVPLGQASAQRILARLAQAIPAAVAQALAQPVGERTAFAPRLAILGARHEAQYSRIFRS